MIRSWSIPLGLALLYASAYFLPLITPFSVYFLPNYFQFLVLPTVVVVLIIAPLLYLGQASLHLPRLSRFASTFKLMVSAGFTLIAIKSCLDAAGFSWLQIVSIVANRYSHNSVEILRQLRMVFVVLAMGLSVGVAISLSRWTFEWLKLLSCLGFAFALLALVRCTILPLGQSQISTEAALRTVQIPPLVSKDAPRRRVIWIIFDELDSKFSIDDKSVFGTLPNFRRLVAQGVSMPNAIAPGRDTLYSLPSLLMGVKPSGVSVQGQSRLLIEYPHGVKIPFSWEQTVFGRLSRVELSSSVVGFYHPYCTVLPRLAYCSASYLGNAGRWFDGVLFFSEAFFSAARHAPGFLNLAPKQLLSLFDPMYRASIEIHDAIPAAIRQEGTALVFIHSNVPHLPAVYAKKHSTVRRQQMTDLEEYKLNLIAADDLLGSIFSAIDDQKNANVLMVVSSDHWLRSQSPHQGTIPIFIWQNQSQEPIRIATPVAAVHTSDFIVDYLSGKISSSLEIHRWWHNKPVRPTWKAPNNYAY